MNPLLLKQLAEASQPSREPSSLWEPFLRRRFMIRDLGLARLEVRKASIEAGLEPVQVVVPRMISALLTATEAARQLGICSYLERSPETRLFTGSGCTKDATHVVWCRWSDGKSYLRKSCAEHVEAMKCAGRDHEHEVREIEVEEKT